MDEYQALLKFLASFARDFVFGKDPVARKQAPTTDAKFGIALCGENAVDELDAGPDTTGILPTAAASTQPFAKDRSRGNEPAVMFFHPPGQGIDLTGGTHADGDDAGQQAGGNSEPGALGDIVHPTDNLETVAGPSREPFQQIGQGLRGALDPRGDDAAGNQIGRAHV